MDCSGFYIWAKQTKDHAAVFDCVCDYVCIHGTVVCTHVTEPGKVQRNY